MARIRDIVVDSEHPPSLARFWAEVLTGYRVRPYDQHEIDRLASLGFTPETDPTVAVDGPGPTLFFQQTSRTDHRRGRIHLDLAGGERALEIERLVGLGASVKEHTAVYTVMLDPEGHPFCMRDPD
jgi:hypothetical protein